MDVADENGFRPGYIGFDETGALEAIRKKPHALLLLDEFEKAHKDVANILLQILDEGIITDSQGRKIDFRNTIIILTSNMGSSILMQPEASDADGRITPAAREAVLQLVAQNYPPELLNRLDEQIVFNRLGRESIAKIVDIRLGELQQMLDDKRIKLDVSDTARAWLANKGYDPVYGARALNRVLTRHVRGPISAALLRGTIRPGDVARFDRASGADNIQLAEIHAPETAKHAEMIEEEGDDLK